MKFMTQTLELNSVLTLISNYAKADVVKKMILAIEPSIDLQEIDVELTETFDMLNLIERLSEMPLIASYDIRSLLQLAKLERDFSVLDIRKIRLFLSMEKDLFGYFSESKRLNIGLRSIESYFKSLTNHRNLLNSIDEKIDLDGTIFDSATQELFQIRKSILRTEKNVQEKLIKLMQDYSSYINESLVVIRNNRFCLPIKEVFKHKVKGVIHDMSASKQTVYIEPEATRQLTLQLEQLQIDESNEILRILAMLSDEIFGHQDTLDTNLGLFIRFDFLQAKALYAKEIRAVKPMINQHKELNLVAARHPLLNVKEVVPINIELNDKQKLILITGPNTGGKTVALKTVGLLTLMTQCGLLIPADESSSIAVFERVFADIGDEQSIQQSLSTFSGHMTKIVSMLEALTDNSLVLLDEIGSGTDPNEGVALAIAILDAFRKKDIRMLVTTHYSELKSYAYEKPNIATASVAFDKKSLKPLYYIQMGTTGSSHALLIARRLGLSEEIINEAKEHYQGRQTDLAKMMEKVNDELQLVQTQKEELSNLLQQTRQEKVNLEQERLSFIKKEDTLLESIRRKEEKQWQKLKEEAKQIILELQDKSTVSKPEIAKYKHLLNTQAPEFDREPLFDTLSVGDEVYILSYQQYGKIVSIKGNKYRVSFGHFEFDFKEMDLRKEQIESKKEKKTAKRKEKQNVDQPVKEIKMEVDLRGFRYEDVKDELDMAIDQAILANLNTLRIIHGFGMGVVRKAVYDYIKKSPYIKSHRFGGEGEGLNGVTIITLK
ncbi:MAG: endonuclease MutS2 [Acholeplasmataceae bacterium]